MSLRIIFMGSPCYAVPTLQALAGSQHELVAVYSQPPKKSGRGMALRPCPVQAFAMENGLQTFTPKSLHTEPVQAEFFQHKADMAIVVAYGLILPTAILEAPRLGCINGHASLLPRWRGAAPIHRAIQAGDRETGVMIMKMEESLDTGPVMLERRLAIGPDETTGQLHDRLAQCTAQLTLEAIDELEAGTAQFTAQSQSGVSYAHKVQKAETRIHWDQPASEVHNHIRAMSPFPGAWCEMEINGKSARVKVLASTVCSGDQKPGTVLDDKLCIACRDGAVRLLTLQKSGKQASNAESFLRGNAILPGTVLS